MFVLKTLKKRSIIETFEIFFVTYNNRIYVSVFTLNGNMLSNAPSFLEHYKLLLAELSLEL